MSTRILIAGIGGASLGTEIAKSLALATGYETFGCDISPLAYGHYGEGFAETFVVPASEYAEAVLTLAQRLKVRAIVPGGEGPLAALAAAAFSFHRADIAVAANAPEVVQVCSEKHRLFERLAALEIDAPRTLSIRHADEVIDFGEYPCIVKPATGSGGSRFVFLATDRTEAELYVRCVLKNSPVALLQEYVSQDEGEFTIGVLSLPSGALVGSIALRRLFHSKLSVSAESGAGLISSGYSQGFVDDFPDIRAQAEQIAKRLGSVGPLNLQGRVRAGRFLPFEINPRFSASTYLRALAGFNEVDFYLRGVLDGKRPALSPQRPGYYLRTLSETFVSAAQVMA